MQLAELNEWFSLAASVAVLLGIVFLIVEIKQNTKSHQSDSRKALLSNDQTALLVALDHHDKRRHGYLGYVSPNEFELTSLGAN